MVLRKLDFYMQKNAIRSIFLHKNHLKMGQRPWYKNWKLETAKENIGKPLQDTDIKAGEMAQWLGAYTAPVEDPSLIFRTQV